MAQMLARLPAAEPDASHFRRTLRLPRPSAEYVAAEIASHKAAAELQALTDRVEALKIEVNVDKPGRTKLPTATLHAMLSDLAGEVAEAQVRERETRMEHHRLRDAYRAEARAALEGDIEGLGNAVAQRLRQVLELLDIAANLTSQARDAGVEFPGLVSGAPIARRLIEPSVSTINKMIGKGSSR